MSRLSEVQYDKVSAACLELFHAGESISFAKVYALIGSRGSQAVVSEMIRRWKQETAAWMLAKRSSPVLPDALVQASDGLVESVWQLALAKAQEVFSEKDQALQRQLEQWQLDLDLSARELEQAQRLSLSLQGEVKGAQALVQSQEVALAQALSRCRELELALQARDEQGVLMREELARTRAMLESERLRHDEGVAELLSSHEAALTQREAQHAQALAQLQQQMDGDRRRLMLQTDELRQHHLAQVAHYKAQLEAAQGELASSRATAQQSRDEAARWQGRSEVVQEELGRVQRILDKINKRQDRGVPKNQAHHPAP